MIKYNPKTWFRHITVFPKSDTLRILFWELIIIGIYTWGLTYLLLEYSYSLKSFKNTLSVHSLVGFVMAMFLAFRTNTAYDRWWEGRKQWGSLVNLCRNIVLKSEAFIKDPVLKERISWLIIAYPYSAKEHLRDNMNYSFESLKAKLDLEYILKSQHRPNAIAKELFISLKSAKQKREIDQDEFLALDQEIRELTDIIGACERIKNTPIPYSYNLLMKKFIFIYSITLPLGLIPDFMYWSIPITMFVFYVMVSLEILAEEIEDPFGTDDNDLPTEELAEKIKSTVLELKEPLRITCKKQKTELLISPWSRAMLIPRPKQYSLLFWPEDF